MINATNESQGFKPLDAGTYPARCYSMVHIGTVTELINGEEKTNNKIRVSWEIPTELKEFKQGEGLKPWVVSKEYNLSMHEKSTLRKDLKAWRGKDFTDEEAKCFDVTRLLGVVCMLSINHKESKGKTYLEVNGVSPIMKGFSLPEQINQTFELNYENFTDSAFQTLPEFIRKKMETSLEYRKMQNNNEAFEFEKAQHNPNKINEANDDLPFWP